MCFIGVLVFALFTAYDMQNLKRAYAVLGEKNKRNQLSVLGAVGAQLNLTNHLGFYVEPGVSYFFDDGSDIQTIRKENPCNFTLQAGFRLSY